ncbi:MAG: P1 family peptidase [Parafannyhessea sp.]|uniref:P1 family peptidase n=1 Tax=Parafannyhessea sp. TaxID=2847324 RepID=UPI003EFCCD46
MPEEERTPEKLIRGVFAASYTYEEAGTGCTVIVCPKGARGAVDVRGGAPATRETDLLRPEETVDLIHAVVLSGGSAYGLAASCGVAQELERQGVGLDVGVGIVPIVSSACLFDLACGDPSVRPTAEAGAEATRRALEKRTLRLQTGNLGAGCGCTVGKFAGPERAMKSGLGQGCASAGSLACFAISAVNACGNVVDPATGRTIAGALSDDRASVLDATEAICQLSEREPWLRTNTTISCVVTNAILTKAQATKVAQMSADAYAHAIHPTHTTNDGDTIFVMATGEVEAPVDVVGMLSTQALERAIVSAATDATSAYGLLAARDL